MLLNIIRVFYIARKTMFLVCCGRKPRYTYQQRVYGTEPDVWETDIPEGGILTEVVSRSIVDEDEVRVRIWSEGSHFVQTNKYDKLFESKTKIPWLWIGGMTRAGNTITLTDEMQKYVVPGNVINIQTLNKLFPQIVCWRIMDVHTFEEVDFPVNGITIEENDT
jgi:hypothetical protein